MLEGDYMDIKNEDMTGEELLELISDKRKLFHSKAQFPNAILINPGYYSILKKVMKSENISSKKIFDLEIFETEDTSSYQLIRIYDPHECSS